MEKSLDTQSFNKLYHDYYNQLSNFAYTYLRDIEAAEDFTTEAFVAYWEVKEHLSPGTNAPAYLLTIIKNKCLNHLQRKSIQNKVYEEIAGTYNRKLNSLVLTYEVCDPDELFVSDVQRIIQKTLDTLPRKTKEIFSLSRFEDKTYKEIATLFHMTPKGVEFHIAKATGLLRKNLKDYLTSIVALFFFTFH